MSLSADMSKTVDCHKHKTSYSIAKYQVLYLSPNLLCHFALVPGFFGGHFSSGISPCTRRQSWLTPSLLCVHVYRVHCNVYVWEQWTRRPEFPTRRYCHGHQERRGLVDRHDRRKDWCLPIQLRETSRLGIRGKNKWLQQGRLGL